MLSAASSGVQAQVHSCLALEQPVATLSLADIAGHQWDLCRSAFKSQFSQRAARRANRISSFKLAKSLPCQRSPANTFALCPKSRFHFNLPRPQPSRATSRHGLGALKNQW